MGSRLSANRIENVDMDVSEILERAATGKLCCLSCRSGCGVTDYAARVCPKCSGPLELRAASGKGRIHSFAVFHTQYTSELAAPYTVLFVELEEGCRLAALLDSPKGPPPKVGDPVVFARTGSGAVHFSLQ